MKKTAPSEDIEQYEQLESEDGRWTLTSTTGEKFANLVPAVQKAVQVLQFVNMQGQPVVLSAIAEHTKITKSHCHGILRTLSYYGWLQFNPDTKSYILGSGLLRDLSSVMRDVPALVIIAPIVGALPRSSGTSCILSMPDKEKGFTVIEKANAPDQLEISYPIGHRFPKDSSAQMKALLAWSEPGEVDAWFKGLALKRYTDATPSSIAQIHKELETTRKQGYALSVDEFTLGIGAIALPVFNASGSVAFILDCVGLSSEIVRNERQVASALIAAVASIHAATGVVPPAGFPTPAT